MSIKSRQYLTAFTLLYEYTVSVITSDNKKTTNFIR